MIISASRRTDIPAFFTPWFINRIRAGYLYVSNPFNELQIRKVSLKPSDVSVIAFWTRNPDRLVSHLSELDERGFRYFFNYTITGYPATIDAASPRPYKAIQSFINLSRMIGSEKVIWRYDPILLSNLVDIKEHKRLFTKIAALLSGHTHRVMVSFATFYRKTLRNLNRVENLIYSDITEDMDTLLELVSYFNVVAKSHGMELQACGTNLDMSAAGVATGKCIDDKYIRDVLAIPVAPPKAKGQRAVCSCAESIEIGMYDTCLHGCTYCYATSSREQAIINKRKHNPDSPILLGDDSSISDLLPVSEVVQGDLF